MKRAALYLRVSTLDQHPESQRHDLEQLAEQRGLEIAGEYTDHGISGARARRPGLDRMMADATSHQPSPPSAVPVKAGPVLSTAARLNVWE